ncbi:DUF2927 domain-containing protein [Jannaschia aquimarina]|uniref:ATP-dependent transcriptional regulator n=1 Tax=Jannaschia aquimarina TaxID=935700 RepID=A0A0D1D899_9RHOB|nr:DUF2927 domain-containing protein [Jannaschia aquimarina]KIT16153.1 hypothetical protein jaqu_21150 [Jannaschia aquimarina]SNT37058.1 Protein of unknown function [Jannaschia aquimarina]
MIRSLALVATLLASCVPTAPITRGAVISNLPAPRGFEGAPAPSPAYPNAQAARDFMDLSFALETGRKLPLFTRFEGPVTIAIEKVDGAEPPATLEPDLDALIVRLRKEAKIDIRRSTGGETPSILVSALPRAKLQRFVPGAACFVVPRVTGWRDYLAKRLTPDLDWATLKTRKRASVFLPTDVSPQEIRDCLHEEVAQALGPLNDLYRLEHSVFNDDNVHVVLTDRDMTILRATYDPALKSGMTPAQVAERLPSILHRGNPRGRLPDGGARPPSSPEWVLALRGALTPRGTPRNRLASAREAVRVADAEGWKDERLAFSLLALGRAALSVDGQAAIAAFFDAGATYRSLQGEGVHSAQVDLQLAAFALSSGEAASALRLADRAIPAAADAQNAILLSTLLLIRAEALKALGKPETAKAVHTEGLAFGRYAWGDRVLSLRVREVAALAPGA